MFSKTEVLKWLSNTVWLHRLLEVYKSYTDNYITVHYSIWNRTRHWRL